MKNNISRTFINDNLLCLGKEKKIPLISGSFHYFRVDKKYWGDILDKIKEMGFSVIDTYIPWSVHEVKKNKFDFGEIKNNNDLNYFLSLCKEKNIYVLVRPGPHINAEITYFGYPKRIFADDSLLAKTSKGTNVVLPVPMRMFPVPSYASEKFYDEVETYFSALCSILKKHLYPEGNIVGIQSDNEMSMFFRTSIYDLDYNSASIKLYQKFLSEKYNDIKILNNLYKTSYENFTEIFPPKKFSKNTALLWHFDWIKYKTFYIKYGVKRIAEILKSKGITGIFYYHNFPVPTALPPFSVTEMEEIVDAQGIDMYLPKESYHTIRKGVSLLSTLSRFPFSPEFSSGSVPWQGKILSLEDQKLTTYSLFMHGIKAVNYYMLIERERWYGSAVTRKGEMRKPYFNFYKNLNAILNELNFPQWEKEEKTVLLYNNEYHYLINLMNLMQPLPLEHFANLVEIDDELYLSEDKLNFKSCIQLNYLKQFNVFYKLLYENKIAFGVSNTEISEEKLKSYKLVVIPTFDFIETKISEKLINFVKGGGILLIGPEVPYLNENFLQFDFWNNLISLPQDKEININNLGKGKIIFTTKINNQDELSEKLNELNLKNFIVPSHKDIDFVVYKTKVKRKNENIIFLANPTNNNITFNLITRNKIKLLNIEDNVEINLKNILTLPPYTIKIYRIIK